MIDMLGLLPKAYMSLQEHDAPVLVVNHFEEIHDPHNWYQPFTTGSFGKSQSLPEDLVGKFNDMLNRAVIETDPASRDEIYREADQLYFDQCVGIPLVIGTSHFFTQQWVHGMIFNSAFPGIYYYPVYKD